jgi:hypothetical protein
MSSALRSTVLVTALALCACATPTTLVERAATLQPGAATTADAIARLGQPNSRSSAASGGTLLQWMENRPGYLNANAAHVAILFDNAGRMVRVTHSFKTDP